MKLLVIGGRMRPAGALDRDHEPLYREGRVACLDTTTGTVEPVFSWRSDRFDRPDLGHCFKGGRWDGDALLLCTEREILRVDPRTWTVVRRWSHPWFNDLHDVARIEGRLTVVSTGLDAVLTLDDAGELRAAEGVLGALRARPDVDYRTVSTKPHASHPNHLFTYGGRIWVTRLLQADAVTLTDPRLRLPIEVGPLHDGLVVGDRVWFTVVDGRLVEVDLPGRRVVRVMDVGGEGPAGWCRGLHLEGPTAYVGFSRLRATRTRAYLARLRGWMRGRQHLTRRPTRVVAIEPGRERRVGEWPVEGAGLDAVFAILPMRGGDGAASAEPAG